MPSLPELAAQLHDLQRQIAAKQATVRLATVVNIAEPFGATFVDVQLASDIETILKGVPVHGAYIPDIGHDVLLIGDIAPFVVGIVGDFTSDAPDPVQGVAISTDVGGLVITWSESADRRVRWSRGTYEVQLDTSGTFNSANLQSFTTAQTSKTAGGLTNGTPYFVRVRAITYRGVPGDWSDIIGPTAPDVTTLDRAIGSDQIADRAIDDPRLLNAFTVEEGANQVDNPSFAVDTGSWSVTGGTITRDLTINRLPSDAQSAKLISNGAFGTIEAITTLMAVQEGGTYIARVPVLSHTIPRHVGLSIIFYEQDGVTITGNQDSSTSNDQTSTTGWMTYAARGIAPAGSAFARIDLIIGAQFADVPNAEQHNITGVEFRRTSHIVGDLRTAEDGPRVELGLRDGFAGVTIWSERNGEALGSRLSSEVDTNYPTNDIVVPVLRVTSPGFNFLDDPAPFAELEMRSLDRTNPTVSRAEMRTLARIFRIRDPLYPNGGNLTATLGEAPMAARLAAATLRHASVDTTVSTTSATPVDIDATNLQVTFTVPMSGEVELRRCALIACGATSANYWGVRDLANVAVAGAIQEVLDTQGGPNNARFRISDTVRITGLNPGDALTWKWTHRSTAAATLSIYHGPNFGAIEMSVWGIFS